MTSRELRSAGLIGEANRLAQKRRHADAWALRPSEAIGDRALALSVFGSRGHDRLLHTLHDRGVITDDELAERQWHDG